MTIWNLGATNKKNTWHLSSEIGLIQGIVSRYICFFANVQNVLFFIAEESPASMPLSHPCLFPARGWHRGWWHSFATVISAAAHWRAHASEGDSQPMGSTAHSDLFLVLRNFHLNTSLDSYQQCVRVPFVHIQASVCCFLYDWLCNWSETSDLHRSE